MDTDKSGLIDYTEFLKAAISKKRLLTDQNLLAAFKFFDLDGNGVITRDEINTVFTKGNINLNDKLCEAIIAEIDANHDNSISFDEFKAMMLRGLENANK